MYMNSYLTDFMQTEIGFYHRFSVQGAISSFIKVCIQKFSPFGENLFDYSEKFVLIM